MSEIRSFLQSILGTYTPVVDQSTGEILPDFAGIDWEYIMSGILLLISVWCVYKVIGAVISKIGG